MKQELKQLVDISGKKLLGNPNDTTGNIQEVEMGFGLTFSGGTVSVELELNGLSDVTTNLPQSPTNADDGKFLFYDNDLGQWTTDDNITHGTVIINAKKSTAGTITKGTPVYLVGFDNDLHTVEAANAGTSSTMPCIGLSADTLDDTNSKHIITFGKLDGVDTSSFSINDDLYVSTTTGQLTATRPTGGNSLIQRIAKVLKVGVSGQLLVFNTARTAGLPNLGTDKLWIGDANGIPQEVDKSTIASDSLYTGSGNVPNGTTATMLGTLDFVGSSVSDWFNVSNTVNNGGFGVSNTEFTFICGGTDQHRMFIGNAVNDYLIWFQNGISGQQHFSVGNVAKIGSENITFDGRTAVKGADTLSTSTAFEIYDNDTTPTKLWDFRNNGDVVTGQSIVFQTPVSNAGISNYRPINAVNYGTGYRCSLNNSSNVRTDYSTFGTAIRQNTAGSEYGEPYIAQLINGTNRTTVTIDVFNNEGFFINTQYFGATSDLFNIGSNPTTGADVKVQNDGKMILSGGNRFPLDLKINSNIGGVVQRFILENSTSNEYEYGRISAAILDNTTGSEDGLLRLDVSENGTLTTKMVVQNDGLILNGTSKIASEDISLQGTTLINGTLDMNNNRITNTIVNPTVQETTSTTTLTINATNENTGVLTAQAVALTVANPTGTIVQGQKLVYRIKDNGTARSITWGSNFRAIGVTLPTTTTANKLLYVGCIYNTTDSKWDVVAVNEEA